MLLSWAPKALCPSCNVLYRCYISIAVSDIAVLTMKFSLRHVFCCFSSFCVECLAFGSGPFQKNCSQACSNISMDNNAGSKSNVVTPMKSCKEKDSQNCWISYMMFQMDGDENYYIEVNPNKGRGGTISPALTSDRLGRWFGHHHSHSKTISLAKVGPSRSWYLREQD